MNGNNARTWNCDDCTVTEMENDFDLHCFEIRMERDGQIRTQTMYPQTIADMEGIIEDLDCGCSPVGAWEDGSGNLVCWANAQDEE